eukprot:CCRYP_001769-RA/>CCRYP_001769-RA protein AED:0.39 eAED:0.39 QI:0/-1/0/1/-1/1/1/0/323
MHRYQYTITGEDLAAPPRHICSQRLSALSQLHHLLFLQSRFAVIAFFQPTPAQSRAAMTRNPTNITVKRKTTLHFTPLKFQFHDSHGRQRREERSTMKAKQQCAQPFNDHVDRELHPTLRELPLNLPANNARGTRRCYGIRSVAERKERRRVTRARGRQNAKSDRSYGKENSAPVKKCGLENDDGLNDAAFCFEEKSVENDASSLIRNPVQLLRGSNESTEDSEKESEKTDDDDDCSPVKQRRLFSTAKKRRFIPDEDSTDDEEMDSGAEKNDDASDEMPTKILAASKTRKTASIADNANPSRKKILSEKQQAKTTKGSFQEI